MQPLSREECEKIVNTWAASLPGVMAAEALNEIVKVVEISVARQCVKKEPSLSFDETDYRELEDCIRIGAGTLPVSAQGIVHYLRHFLQNKKRPRVEYSPPEIWEI